MMGVVASGTRDDALAGNRTLDRSQQLDLLRVAKARRLTCGARDDDAVRAVVDEHDRQLLGPVVVHRSIGLERGDHRCQQTSDLFAHFLRLLLSRPKIAVLGCGFSGEGPCRLMAWVTQAMTPVQKRCGCGSGFTTRPSLAGGAGRS